MDYMHAFQEASNTRQDVKGTFSEIIEEFLNSKEFSGMAERTQKDHRKHIVAPNGIDAQFGKAPIQAFEHKRIRAEVLRWRDSFAGGTGDNMMATMQRIVSFAYQRGTLGFHHLLKIKKRVKSNRAHIIWMPEEIDALVANAPEYVGNILIAAIETGYRPGDLYKFGWHNIEQGRGNRSRFVIRTEKSNRKTFAAVPITPQMENIIAKTPKEQTTFIVNHEGQPFKEANSLGAVVHDWRDKLGLRKELHLYDARGNAVTRLVRAGCTIAELAAHMGWSLAHAADMVDRYAALDPEMTDDIRGKVESWRRRQEQEGK